MAAEAKAQTELQDFGSLFSLEGKVAVVVCLFPLRMITKFDSSSCRFFRLSVISIVFIVWNEIG